MASVATTNTAVSVSSPTTCTSIEGGIVTTMTTTNSMIITDQQQLAVQQVPSVSTDQTPRHLLEVPSQPDIGAGDALSAQRVFKKCSPNNKLTLYLSSRDLVVSNGKIDRLQGVLLIDPEYVDQRKVYGQVTLTFRYGREDEEVMGLKFCNEAVMCLTQLYPPHPQNTEPSTALQDALVKRLGPNAYPFTMEITPLAPPSVQLVPAKEYKGAPIGTSYDVRAYIAERADEKLYKRAAVRMGLRVVQRACAPPSPTNYNPVMVSLTPMQQQSLQQQTKPGAKITLFGSKNITAADDQKTELQRYSATPEAAKRSKKDSSLDVDEITYADEDDNKLSPTNRKITKKMDVEQTQLEEMRTNQIAEIENVQRKKSLKEIENMNLLTGQKRGNDLHMDDIELLRATLPPPRAVVVKTFMMSDGQIELEGSLDKAIYSHGEDIKINVTVNNRSRKTVRRIKVFTVQHVDVCMFSNGKFKNVVASIDSKDGCPLHPGSTFNKQYNLVPTKGQTKNWIALEDSYTKTGTSLASTVSPNSNSTEERNVFAIYVSYYVKIKLIVSVTTSEVSLKLPFTLMHSRSDFESTLMSREFYEKKIENVSPTAITLSENTVDPKVMNVDKEKT